MNSVFDTPRTTSTVDTKLMELVRTKMNRRNSMRGLSEAAEAKVEADANMKKLEAIDSEDAAKKALEDKVDDRKVRVSKEAASRAAIGLEARLYEAGCKEMFNETIFEMVYNACWIDDAVKENTLHAMYESYNKVIETLNANGITVDMKSDVTPFIKNVRIAVNEACSKAAKRIVKDDCVSGACAKDINDIDFNMNQDELDELANSLSDLGKEDIEELVKNKVLAVVQDEKTKGAEKAAEIESIKKAQDETLSDVADDGEVEDTVANESFNKLVERSRNMKAHRRTGTSLFECLMMSNTHKLRESASTMESAVSDDMIMGAALQETVLVYTIMETLNTLGLCKFNNTNVNKLCDLYRIGLK